MKFEDLSEHVVVCVGHGSEYAFNILAYRLRRAGLTCIEIDTMEEGWRAKLPLIKTFRRRTLLSSQHPYINRQSWRHFYGIDTDIIDLAEAIDLIAPDRTFYVPHDLGFPIKDEEIGALTRVDAALMPSDSFWYLRRVTTVINVGWIGSLSSSDGVTESTRTRLAFLPSEIGYYSRRGVDFFVRRFDPVLRLGPVVKFPMMEGVEPFEQALRDMGLDVLPSRSSAGELIARSSIVVSNGLSSVVFETHNHGSRAICLIDGSQPEMAQRQYFAPLDNLVLVTPEDTERLIKAIEAEDVDGVRSVSRLVCDFDLILKIIRGDMEELPLKGTEI